MNTNPGKSLVHAAVDALKELGIDADFDPRSPIDPSSDGVLTLHRDGKALKYVFEVRRSLTPSLIGPLSVAFTERTNDRILITDHVTPPMADELRRRQIQFVDAAGNAFLDRRGILVFVSGRRARNRRTPLKTLRVFRRTGLKVGFVLIAVPELASAPQRSIAQAAGVALGSVAATLEGLRELGFVAEVRGERRLVNRERLLDQWTEAYARQLAPTLEIARFSGASAGWWRRADLTKYDALWGGETAAAVLQRHLVPERTIVYVDEPPAALLREHRLRSDAAGPIIFRRRFWNAVPAPRPDVVPPLLIYADLVTAGDARSLEGARRIRNAYLV